MPEMQRTELRGAGVSMLGLSNINILVGRNGSGKSRFLRKLDIGLAQDSKFYVRYISPDTISRSMK